MNLSATILGTTTVEQLKKTAGDAVLQIGKDRFTRHDLAGVECFNFVAARNLSQVLHDQLQVKDLREVYETVAPSALALPKIGAISLAVLGAAFEAKGLGGDNPLETWARKHAGSDNGRPARLTTFHTIKQHYQEQQAQARGKQQSRRRRR